MLICDDALRLGLVVGKGSDRLGMVVCAGGGGRSVEWILALLNKYMAHGEKKHGRAKKTFTRSPRVKRSRKRAPRKRAPRKRASRWGAARGEVSDG